MSDNLKSVKVLNELSKKENPFEKSNSSTNEDQKGQMDDQEKKSIESMIEMAKEVPGNNNQSEEQNISSAPIDDQSAERKEHYPVKDPNEAKQNLMSPFELAVKTALQNGIMNIINNPDIMQVPIVPLNEGVLISPLPDRFNWEESASGLVFLDQLTADRKNGERERRNISAPKGVVVQVSNISKHRNRLKPGMIVYFRESAGDVILFHTKEYRFIYDADIISILAIVNTSTQNKQQGPFMRKS